MSLKLFNGRLITFQRVAMRRFQSSVLPEGAKAFINGKWLGSTSGKVFEVTNPYTSEPITDVPDCNVQDTEIAVQAAREAFTLWASETTAKQRGETLRRWFEILRDREDELAKLLTEEQGKPLAEAKIEIQYSGAYFDWYAGEARRIYGQVVQPPVLNRTHLHIREPIGVVVAITPWNFPTAMIARKAAAALASGCTMVVKPAHDTPLSALALAAAASDAGVPRGVFNVVPAGHENTQEISKFVCSSPNVDCISFTGSTGVGKLLLSQSASTVKRVCLELGGNAPFIVFQSADLDKAVKGAIASKARASGQTCVSSNRYYVHESVHAEFVNKLKEAISALKCGDGLKEGTTQGPMINKNALHKVQFLVDDAVDKGAEVVVGGKYIEETNIYKPTILINVNESMELANQEIFGPVVAIQKFSDEKDVIKKANSTRYGLASYIFSEDYRQINRVYRALQSGMVGVNEGAISCSEAAFGGVKESGMGREGGSQGIDEFTQWKYVCIGE
ncbi:unnamed protein product [Bursaphelenchus xylophilus]|uniref:(pine wood nematode) hypothetical protein n=1 Tax=Bursaphelenchus xylophilus TaxID=6326 RepID=A0A1I7RP91_BURXY|nr:unnamed protein product [Bursaphelenchus xylophilus]CAG9095613.1 unnamed protein product [Bursaphelenchus xylophilus]